MTNTEHSAFLGSSTLVVVGSVAILSSTTSLHRQEGESKSSLSYCCPETALVELKYKWADECSRNCPKKDGIHMLEFKIQLHYREITWFSKVLAFLGPGVGQSQCCFASLNSSCLSELARQSWQVSVPVTACRAPRESSREMWEQNPVPKNWFQGGSRLELGFCVPSLFFVFRGEDLAELCSWSSRYHTDVLHLR